MVLNPKDFKVLSFDIYGTLIDWESGIFNALLPLAFKLPTSSSHHPSNNTERETRVFLLTEYTNLEKAIQIESPTLAYPKVLAEIYRRLATKLSIPFSESEAEEFGTTIGKWPAFPDTIAAMQELAKHYKLIVLSNVSRSSFNETLSGPLKGVKFDAIYTAEDVGSYKPDLKNFEYLIKHAGEEFGAKKEEILKVAQSLYHDHIPAKKVGLQPSVWIQRAGDETLMGGKLKDYEGQVALAESFDTLGDLAAVVKKAFTES